VVRLRERTGNPALLGQALTTLSRMLYMVNDPGGSSEAVGRAVALLEPLGDRPRLARAATYQAAILKLTDRPAEAIARASEALALGEATGQPDVVAHSLNYLGYAMLDLGDAAGAGHLRRSVEVAQGRPPLRVLPARLHQPGRGAVPAGPLRRARRADRRGPGPRPLYGFASHEYNLEAHRCMLLTLRGRFPRPRPGCGRLLAGEDPGVLASFGLSALGRLLARRATPAPLPCSERAWRAAARTDSVQAIALAGTARVEAAWLAGDPAGRGHPGQAAPGAGRGQGGRALPGRAAAPAGPLRSPARAFDGCPPEYALGSRATGAVPPTPGRPWAPPTSRPWSWPTRGGRRRCWRGLRTLEQLGATAAADLVRPGCGAAG
jgi:hypothetical protein